METHDVIHLYNSGIITPEGILKSIEKEDAIVKSTINSVMYYSGLLGMSEQFASIILDSEAAVKYMEQAKGENLNEQIKR